jgi:predicted enzyme involved in methoxymalonyl-ACP biosynthesis
MAQRRREGMLLALASKNNEEDVVETFAAHPEFPLQLSDFTARRINWDAKGPNLASLALELEVGLDTFHPGRRQSQGMQRNAGWSA